MEKKRIERLEKIGYFTSVNTPDPIKELTNSLLRRTPAILNTEMRSLFDEDEFVPRPKHSRLTQSNLSALRMAGSATTKYSDKAIETRLFHS